MEELLVVKIGGNIIDNSEALDAFLQDFAAIAGNKILVHGGGKLATELSSKLGIATTMVEGRRITDEETIKVVTMTYAGWINKSIVASLQSKNCNAVGLTGVDANLIPAVKRPVKEIDYGLVGDIDKNTINSGFLKNLLLTESIPVIAPISSDTGGHLLNINADTIARTLAEAMSTYYNVTLVYCFEKMGLLSDINDTGSVIDEIDLGGATRLKQTGVISMGMIPKVDNALGAISGGVTTVVIGHAANIKEMAKHKKGFGTYLKA